MKVLIVGKGSFIGTKFKEANKNRFEISELDSLKPFTVDDLRGYDVVYHVAGIAHVSKKKGMESLYFKVNRDLAIETCKKAREAGVKQFIFMSSMIIYGKDNKIGKPFVINADTIPNPADFYGQSKLDADLAIQAMNSEEFKTLVIRTPMVYGEGCKGNYPKLKKTRFEASLHSEYSQSQNRC